MVKLWGKIIQDEKIIKSCTFEKNKNFSLVDFIEYIMNISHEMDIPTPVILKTHLKNFFNFNSVRFTKADFIEEFDYDEFIIENAIIAD